MKILNLYAGIGGNRKLWGDEHEVTAIEINPEIAGIYKYNFPNDNVIVTDSHQYLLQHYTEFDFIWRLSRFNKNPDSFVDGFEREEDEKI